METRNVSIKDLASMLGTTYEYVRQMVRGLRFPSPEILAKITDALGADAAELSRLAAADRKDVRYSELLALAGDEDLVNPIEKIWRVLSPEHRHDLVVLARYWARRDARRR